MALKFIEEKTVAISKESNKENVRTKIVADLKEDSKNIGNFKNNLCNITNVNAKFSKDDGINFSMCPYSKKSSEAILLTTGADKSFSLINIYDMAGNVWEWTFEKMTMKVHLVRAEVVDLMGEVLSIQLTGVG